MTVLYENLWRHMMMLCNTAACAAAYDAWSDEFSRSEIRNSWRGTYKAPRLTVKIDELRALTHEQRVTLGISLWDEDLLLLPLWMFPCIAEGESLVSISGITKVVGVDEIHLDVRFGCIAWGFRLT